MQEVLQHFINGLSLGSIYALIALGYTMVYGILQLINFAHGDVYMIGAFITYYAFKHLGISENAGFGSLILMLAIAMTGSALLAFTIERLAYRPLRTAPKINILITAIGVSLFLEYSAQVVFGADPKQFPPLIENSVLWQWGDVTITMVDCTVLAVGLLMMGALNYLVFHTKMGKAMRAVSQNTTVASLMGINIDRIISFTFVIGASLAGVASVLVGLKYPKIDPLMGVMMGLKAFVAAVLGGIGSISGAVLGGIILGLSEEFVVAAISSTYRDALAFVILIIILLFRPNGLLGKKTTEKV